MKPIKKIGRDIQALSGNPVVVSLDGKRKAPLKVILHPSWTPKERAAFGVYLVDDDKPKDTPSAEIVERPALTSEQKVEQLLSRFGLTLAEFKTVVEL